MRDIKSKSIKNRLSLNVSPRTIQRYVNYLGWRKIRAKYCQFVSVKNRIERLIFSQLCLLNNEQFLQTVFVDESTVQESKNARKVWYNPDITGETRIGLIGRYAHPLSVHVIGGISRNGPTELIVFTGKMDGTGFQELADEFLVPFIRQVFPNYHRLQMDNAPGHASGDTQRYLEINFINHFKTPAQSPDLNPIELVWNDTKVFIAEEVKPTIKEELINGIMLFWRTKVTVEYCNSKINHLNKVLNQIIKLKGKATGM